MTIHSQRRRPNWAELPDHVQATIVTLLGGRVTTASTCPGGHSPGLASRLTLHDGRRAFVKAIDGAAWPDEIPAYRAEARVAAALPEHLPAPRYLGGHDDGQWAVLAFEDIDGTQPAQPWQPATLQRVATAVAELSRTLTPSPLQLPHDHPRLGGWRRIAEARHRNGPPDRFEGVASVDAANTGGGDRDADGPDHALLPRWADRHLAALVELERDGLAIAHGDALVHFDLYPHNVIVSDHRVTVVDWPHARRGHPAIDLIMLLSSAAADDLDPEPLLRTLGPRVDATHHTVNAVLTAHAGFLLAGALSVPADEHTRDDRCAPGPPPPAGVPGSGRPTGHGPTASAVAGRIAAAKHRLGVGALTWLRRRLPELR